MSRDLKNIFIYGKHAVSEALIHRPKSVKELFLIEGDVEAKDEIVRAKQIAREYKIKIVSVDAKTILNNLPKGATHQGMAARILASELVVPYDAFIETLPITSDTSVLILGEVEDPHNVGAVIRSAAAFGVSAVLIPEHNQAPVNGTVVKVSVGMAFRIPLVAIGNVNATIEDLKKRGFWVYGLDGESTQSLNNEKFEKATAFVLGNEGRGLREKTKEACDVLLSIPMHPKCESLNAAASAAVVLYKWSAEHPRSLTS